MRVLPFGDQGSTTICGGNIYEIKNRSTLNGDRTMEKLVKFVCVQAFATEQEALLAQAELQMEGISAVLESSSAATTFSYVGSAMGGVRLMVDATDQKRAENVLEQIGNRPKEGPWYCQRCRETLDSSFDCCWSCGGERAEVQGTLPEEYNHQANAKASSEQADGIASDLSTRAWRAAVIGLVTLPGILHFYSLLLVFNAMSHAAQWTPTQIRRLSGAFVIDIAAITTCAILFRHFALTSH